MVRVVEDLPCLDSPVRLVSLSNLRTHEALSGGCPDPERQFGPPIEGPMATMNVCPHSPSTGVDLLS